MKRFTGWSPPALWRAAMLLARGVTRALSRLEVTGSGGYETRHGMILAVNHISNFDPIAITAACSKVGIAPRYMAQEQLFTAPVIGAFMRACGHIRVDRDKPTAARALLDAHAALEEGSAIVIYPEGRIGLDPGLWPERGKTGAGRLALATGAQVIPVAIWGAHEVLPYTSPTGMWPGMWRSLRTRPTVKVHFGRPIPLDDLDPARPGTAQRLTDRIIDAIYDELVTLRVDEPDLPRHVDPTRRTETRRTHHRAAR